jgi:hypothetical protein
VALTRAATGVRLIHSIFGATPGVAADCVRGGTSGGVMGLSNSLGTSLTSARAPLAADEGASPRGPSLLQLRVPAGTPQCRPGFRARRLNAAPSSRTGTVSGRRARVPAGTLLAIAQPVLRDAASGSASRPGSRGNRAHAAQLTAVNGHGCEWPRHEPRPRCSGIKRAGDTRFPVIARIRVRKTGPPCARSWRLSPLGTVSRHLPTLAQRTSTAKTPAVVQLTRMSEHPQLAAGRCQTTALCVQCAGARDRSRWYEICRVTGQARWLAFAGLRTVPLGCLAGQPYA